MAANLGAIDVIVLVVSMMFSALIGLYFTTKNRSMDSYMRGDGKLSLIPVSLSLMTSCTSGLSLLGSSAEVYYQGPSYSLIAFAVLLSGPITAYTILPVFHKLNELSLHKYLELRYGLVVKYLVSIIFIFQMIFYNSVVLYLPSIALEAILGVPKFYSILIIGIMCVLYSSIGGLKAVVWTDLFQGILMYASILVVGILGTLEAGGVTQIFKIAADGGRLKFEGLFNLDLVTRHTIFGLFVGATIKHTYLLGVNQVQLQRALSLPTLRQSQYAFVFCSVFTCLINLIATYLGYVMYAAYQSCDPYLAGEVPKRDAAIVHYVAHRFDNIPGFRGLFVAGLFSATLSTLSSFSNSMAALALEDFIKPVMRRTRDHRELSDSASTCLAKTLATCFGLICVLVAYLIDQANSRLLQATTTLFGAIGVPFLAAFMLGIFTRYTNSKGIVAAFIVTISFGIYITIKQTFFSPPLEPSLPVYYNEQCARVFNGTSLPKQPPFEVLWRLPAVRPEFSLGNISYMMIPIIQLVLTVLVGSVVSLLTGGWTQAVKNEYLVSMLHRDEEEKDNFDAKTLSEQECGFDVMDPSSPKGFYPITGCPKSLKKDSDGHEETEQNGSAAISPRRKLGVTKNEHADEVNDHEKTI